MNKKRGKLEILMEILNVVYKSGGAKKTRIMQSAYLDWRNFKKHFDFLVEKGFLSEIYSNSDRVYCISKKGKELLEKLVELYEITKKL